MQSPGHIQSNRLIAEVNRGFITDYGHDSLKGQGIKDLRFSAAEINDFTNILSRERIDHWKLLASGPNMKDWRSRISCRIPVTDEYAILLHEWNSALSSAFMASLQIFEISIRNHMHSSLTDNFNSPDWWGQSIGNAWRPSANIIGNQVADVQRAIDVSARRTKGVTSGGVISELSFGFWLALLSQSYDNPSANVILWRSCLHNAFSLSGKISRKDIQLELSSIVALRNKCAHHVPIVDLDLNLEFLHLLKVARRFSITTAEWINKTSLVPALLKPDWLSALSKAGRLVGMP